MHSKLEYSFVLIRYRGEGKSGREGVIGSHRPRKLSVLAWVTLRFCPSPTLSILVPVWLFCYLLNTLSGQVTSPLILAVKTIWCWKLLLRKSWWEVRSYFVVISVRKCSTVPPSWLATPEPTLETDPTAASTAGRHSPPPPVSTPTPGYTVGRGRTSVASVSRGHFTLHFYF